MSFLLISCAAFLALHIGISSTPLRAMLLARLGENAYLGVYSLLAFASLGAMIYAYAEMPHTAFLWLPGTLAFSLTKGILLLAIVLIVMGNMTKNPTAVKMQSAIDNEIPGIVKITRHPLQWGILLFALGHLISNGDAASVVFFSTLVLVSMVGMVMMDRRKKASAGEKWQGFFATTSLIPFAAILSGRIKFRLAELNWLAVGIGIALYLAAFRFHSVVSGGPALI